MAGELQGLGRWRLLDVCTEGEFATIYRARAEDAGVTAPSVALKVVRTESLHDELETEAFTTRTARAVALSDTAPHPAIVRVREHGEADGRAWAAMELVDGLSLDRIGGKRSRGRVPVEGAVVVLQDLLAALESARNSANPTSHGRVGRSHILVDVDGSVRLLGFGSPDQEQADLLAVGRLAGQLAKTWPTEVDAWIDKLKDGDTSFETAGEALEAFPLDAFDDDVLQKGRAALAQVVVRERKKAERAAAKAREAEAPLSEGDEAGELPQDDESSDGDVSLGRLSATGDYEGSVRQARGVMWACATVVAAAVVVELLRFGG